MRAKRAAYLVGAVVGVVGIVLALAPSATLDAVCPWLAKRDGQGQAGGAGGGGHAEPAARNAALYPFARLRFLAEGVFAPRTPSGWRAFTRSELSGYDGTDPWRPILLGMNGDVFDVTEKGYFYYGPGAGYHVFAGKDSTRSLALGSLEDSDVGRWDTDDFDDAGRRNLAEQHAFYADKYVKVGELVQ